MVVITDFLLSSVSREAHLHASGSSVVADESFLELHVNHNRSNADNETINSLCLPVFAPSSLSAPKRPKRDLSEPSQTSSLSKRKRDSNEPSTVKKGRGRPRKVKVEEPVQATPGEYSYEIRIRASPSGVCPSDWLTLDSNGVVVDIQDRIAMQNLGLPELAIGDRLVISGEQKGVVDPSTYFSSRLSMPSGENSIEFRGNRVLHVDRLQGLKGMYIYPGELYAAVEDQGGYDAVVEGTLWQRVRRKLGLKEQSSSGFLLRKTYESYFM